MPPPELDDSDPPAIVKVKVRALTPITMTVALKNKPPVVVPAAALRRAGFKRGQDLEVKTSGGIITIRPKLPAADDEYTPGQRRVIDARLKKALEEVKRGQTAGPFNTADEMIASLKRELKSSATKKAKPRSR
jgi:bifunctional DNA-binding transcriptional regulator/antitoxin component of YhaV-PrlF toxin-antitoxin module